MSDLANEILEAGANYYYNELIRKIIHSLKRAPQEYRLNPNCGLNNVWDEICVQKQGDNWSGWQFLDDYIDSQCKILLEQQPTFVQQVLSFEFLINDELVIHQGEVCEKLKSLLFDSARIYNNARIEKYLFE